MLEFIHRKIVTYFTLLGIRYNDSNTSVKHQHVSHDKHFIFTPKEVAATFFAKSIILLLTTIGNNTIWQIYDPEQKQTLVKSVETFLNYLFL